MTGRAFQGYGVVIAAAGILALSLMIVQRTGGALIYTLDDPYIHLAVAGSTLAGGYGINPGEYASPSSSILYPVLLAALLALGVGTLSPLALAGAASLWSAWLIAGIIRDNATSPGPSRFRGCTLVTQTLRRFRSVTATSCTRQEEGAGVATAAAFRPLLRGRAGRCHFSAMAAGCRLVTTPSRRATSGARADRHIRRANSAVFKCPKNL